MNRIDAAFGALRRENGKALIAYLTVGFPSVGALPRIVQVLVDEGVDLIELGIPFSDPLADGPTIQAASQWALKHGVTVKRVFESAETLRRRHPDLPLVLMTYYNPISRFGVKAFCRECRRRDLDGLIVPDLPPEEATELLQAARPAGLDVIFLAAPTSPADRLKRIAQSSSGFIYYVSLTGVTGARLRFGDSPAGDTGKGTVLRGDTPLRGVSPAGLSPLRRRTVPFDAHVRSIKRMTNLPVCVGFGISRPEQVRQVVRAADGAIIGSALLEEIGRSKGGSLRPVREFVRKLRAACRAPSEARKSEGIRPSDSAAGGRPGGGQEAAGGRIP